MEEKPKHTIDLGLGDLLSPGQSESNQQETQVKVEQSDRKSGVGDDYVSLAEAGLWSDIVNKSEQELEAGDTLAARLWWVRAHCAMASLPLSVLLAPLDRLISECSASKDLELQALLRTSIREYWDKLQEVGDSKLTPVVYDKFRPYLDNTNTDEVAVGAKGSKKGSSVFSKFLLAIFVLTIGLYITYKTILDDSNIVARDLSVSLESIEPELIKSAVEPELPVVERQQVSTRDSLSSVLDTLEVSTSKVNERPNSVTDTEKNPVQQIVNTESPVEPLEVKQMLEQDPTLDPQPIKSVKVVVGEKNTSRNIFRSPDSSADRKNVREGKSSIEAGVYLVKRDSPVRRYPRVSAPVVAALLIDDEVYVEQQVGKWLQIVSKKGNIGYIPTSVVSANSLR